MKFDISLKLKTMIKYLLGLTSFLGLKEEDHDDKADEKDEKDGLSGNSVVMRHKMTSRTGFGDFSRKQFFCCLTIWYEGCYVGSRTIRPCKINR